MEEEARYQEAKADAGKLQMMLMLPAINRAVVRVREYGILKYKDKDNWKKVSIEKYVAAFHRHFNDWRLGIDLDKDSSMHHLKHALWNIATIAWLEIEGNKPKKG